MDIPSPSHKLGSWRGLPKHVLVPAILLLLLGVAAGGLVRYSRDYRDLLPRLPIIQLKSPEGPCPHGTPIELEMVSFNPSSETFSLGCVPFVSEPVDLTLTYLPIEFQTAGTTLRTKPPPPRITHWWDMDIPPGQGLPSSVYLDNYLFQPEPGTYRIPYRFYLPCTPSRHEKARFSRPSPLLRALPFVEERLSSFPHNGHEFLIVGEGEIHLTVLPVGEKGPERPQEQVVWGLDRFRLTR